VHRVVAALAVLGGFAVATVPAAADPPKDYVKGNGENSPPNGKINSFHLNVQSGPNGEDAKGFVTFTSQATKRSFTAEARCLRVVDNQAVVVADLSKVRKQPGSFDAAGVIVWVEDNGDKTLGRAPDEIRNSVRTVDTLPDECPPPMDPAAMTLNKGNIRVGDA
jgi:predicted SnoaL-like aldol condensation-catalyzing enzyme